MLDFKIIKEGDKSYIETSLTGKPLLTTPQLNKGTAFSQQERIDFGLLGKLPPRIETLEEQVLRAYEQFNAYSSDLKRHLYLNNLHDTNQVLFYKLVTDHLQEMLPLIYTPHVGTAVKEFSHNFRQPRGLYITYQDKAHIKELLENRSNPEVDLIVVTDGEAVLGIGDQGIGAINIPIAKLMVYTLCGNINPTRTLPIVLDVGTNNQTMLNDPMYLGWRNPRLQGQTYEDFIISFIDAIKEIFPRAFLHWEDLAYGPASRNLELCQNKICSFNDDIQGTGAAALATILATCQFNQTKLCDQKIVIFGAGAAGTGIAKQILSAMIMQGLSETDAKKRFWLIDRPGLLTTAISGTTKSQSIFLRDAKECANWQRAVDGSIGLYETIKHVQPTILIGCSSVTGAFTEAVVREMSNHVERPLIMPLSNPTMNSEATPQDIYHWTNGKALIATGSPFPPIEIGATKIPVAQCNNALIFPGLGLGIIAVNAKAVSDKMIWSACHALSQNCPILKDPQASLLPSLSHAREVAQKIALAVAKQAYEENLTDLKSDTEIPDLIAETTWEPYYLPFVLKK